LGCQGSWAELKNSIGWQAELILNIFSRLLVSNSKDSNIFKPNLNGSQTKLNLNKLFKDFSNLDFLKICLNIQIQTEA
jgi:hypothetical protein